MTQDELVQSIRVWAESNTAEFMLDSERNEYSHTFAELAFYDSLLEKMIEMYQAGRQSILAELPVQQEAPLEGAQSYRIGFNDCLQEVKTIIGSKK